MMHLSFRLLLLAAIAASVAALTAHGQTAASTATEEAGLAALRERISVAPVLRGDFAQEKHIEGFRNPLRSSGHFLIARERGVLWQTLAPFPSEVVLTRDQILSRRGDGAARVEVDARQQPALGTINAVMFALLGGDVDALASRFQLHATVPPNGDWKLELVPRAGAIAQVFEHIELEGDRQVRRVEMRERSGDRTLLTFSNLREEPARLSHEEANRFE